MTRPHGVLAILQARLSSSRLPAKVLAPLIGEPMILRQLERIRRSTAVSSVIVATSTDPTDDPLAVALEEHGVPFRRGPLNDVFSRFARVIDEFRPEHVVRLTADCPLADPAVIDRVVIAHVASGADYSSNCLTRTYPHGLDVECFTAGAFAKLSELPLTPPEREHVTLGFYSRPSEFTLNSITQPVNRSAERWTVDYPSDLEFVRTVFASLHPRNHAFTTSDVLEFIGRNPGLRHTEADI